MELREKRASIGIAMMFIVLAVTVGVSASIHLDEAEPPKDASSLIALSAPSVVVFLALGMLKCVGGVWERLGEGGAGGGGKRKVRAPCRRRA